MMACQLSSSQRSLAEIVVVLPQWKFSWPGDASFENVAVARLSSGAAAARPSVTRVLRPSRSRSDARIGRVDLGAALAARDTSTRLSAEAKRPAKNAAPHASR